MADQPEADKKTLADLEPRHYGHQPMFNVPSSVLVLLAIMGLVHGARTLMTPEQDLNFLVHMAFVPARYIDGLLASGLTGFTSFVTYNFLHGDMTHLVINSVWMLAMGSAVAKRIGNLRFVLFSFICGLFAALAHMLAHFGEVAPVIGASGAISGHMAAAIRFLFSVDNNREGARKLQSDLRSIPLKRLSMALRDARVIAILVIWLLTNVISGMGIIPMDDGSNLIAWEAHIGGFIAGLLLFSLFDPSNNGDKEETEEDWPS